jgi:hypothetical protein
MHICFLRLQAFLPPFSGFLSHHFIPTAARPLASPFVPAAPLPCSLPLWSRGHLIHPRRPSSTSRASGSGVPPGAVVQIQPALPPRRSGRLVAAVQIHPVSPPPRVGERGVGEVLRPAVARVDAAGQGPTSRYRMWRTPARADAAGPASGHGRVRISTTDSAPLPACRAVGGRAPRWRR